MVRGLHKVLHRSAQVRAQGPDLYGISAGPAWYIDARHLNNANGNGPRGPSGV